MGAQKVKHTGSFVFRLALRHFAFTYQKLFSIIILNLNLAVSRLEFRQNLLHCCTETTLITLNSIFSSHKCNFFIILIFR